MRKTGTRKIALALMLALLLLPFCRAAAPSPEAPDAADGGRLPANVNIPVLMYHAIGEEPWGIESLFVRPEDFEAQLQYLTDNGFDPIWFSDLSHIEDYDKPVILTFDDGYANNCTEAFPLLRKYGVKATVFVITSLVGTPAYMTEAQLSQLAGSGLVSIQSHTATHPDLRACTRAELEAEFSRSRQDIVRITGRVPTVISYPSGLSDPLARQVAGDYFQLGVKARGRLWNTSSDPFQVPRQYVSRDCSLSAFKRLVSRAGVWDALSLRQGDLPQKSALLALILALSLVISAPRPAKPGKKR